MSEYTQFFLRCRNVNHNQYEELLGELKRRDIYGYALTPGRYEEEYKTADFMPFDMVKWKDHPKDMVLLSERFPNIQFTLTGNGEDLDDFWMEIYKDGDVKFSRGEVVYEQPKKVQWNELIA